MVVLNIHLEGIERDRFKDQDIIARLREISERGLPVALSLPPFLEQYWLEKCPELIELVKHLVTKKQSVLGQQGNLHKCKYPHKHVDPWHENYCLWRKHLPAEEQKDLMERGRRAIRKIIRNRTRDLCAT